MGHDAVEPSEAAAVKARIGNVKRKDVLIVPVDTSPIPSWLKGTVIRSSGVTDGQCGHRRDRRRGRNGRRIAEAHDRRDHRGARRRGRTARKARTTFLTSQRALTLINRELDSLSATVLKLCETPGHAARWAFAAEVRRTPDRYTVQIGPVGLSFSWIRGRSNSIADGQLLVIEWSGQLGEQHAPADPRNAMPAFEHVLQPHATSPDDWQWRRADLDLCCYTTRDLAEQCVASVVRRLPVADRSGVGRRVPRDIA